MGQRCQGHLAKRIFAIRKRDERTMEARWLERGVHDAVALWFALEKFSCDITGVSDNRACPCLSLGIATWAFV